MIILSKKEIPPNFGLLYGFLNFWNISVNAFVLPCSMMSPVLYNIATILGLLIDGDELPSIHNLVSEDLDFKVSKKNLALLHLYFFFQ